MDFSVIKRFAAGALCLAGGVLHAQNLDVAQPVKMKHCLADKLPAQYPVLAEDAKFRIVNIPARELGQLTRLADKAQCGRFVNLAPEIKAGQTLQPAQARALLKKAPRRAPAFRTASYEIRHPEAVNDALDRIEPQNIHNTLSQLVAFQNRSAFLKNGVDAAEWLKGQYDAMVTRYGRTDADSYFVDTGWYKQPSLVTVLGKDLPGPGIVIGAHMDTLGYDPSDRMPGAGDDGSGSSTVMEIARVLMESNFTPSRPIYIIWYAAEEQGLVGSKYVVRHFDDKNIAVNAAIQFDMTGYRVRQDDPTMWLFRDNTDRDLTDFSAQLIETYVKAPVEYTTCGYACSDHASWDEVGVPAAFPCESSFERHNPNIHTPNDTMDELNLEHMTNFTRLGLALAIELASD